MSYDVVDIESHGDTGSTHGVLEINVMRDSLADTAYWDKAYNYVANEVGRIYNNTSLDGALVRKYDTDALIDCDNLFQSGNKWLDANDLTHDGVFQWIVGGCSNTFIAVAAPGPGAWNKRKQSFVGQNSRKNKHQVATQAVHEGLHPYLAADNCNKIINDILNGDTDGDNSNDHNLGDVYTTKGDKSSPMLGHYDDYEAEAGNCNDNAQTVDGYSRKVTSCTMTALELSSEHDAGNH